MTRVLPTFVLFVLGLSSGASHAQAPDVRQLMTPEEFEAAGLAKLSAEQLAALNQWVLRYTARDVPELTRNNPVVQAEVEKVEAEGVRTRIVGDFRGWSGDTIFTLENGQVWKQRLDGRWFYRAESPEVELRRNAMGYWVLRVIERDRSVGVTRLK